MQLDNELHVKAEVAQHDQQPHPVKPVCETCGKGHKRNMESGRW